MAGGRWCLRLSLVSLEQDRWCRLPRATPACSCKTDVSWTPCTCTPHRTSPWFTTSRTEERHLLGAHLQCRSTRKATGVERDWGVASSASRVPERRRRHSVLGAGAAGLRARAHHVVLVRPARFGFFLAARAAAVDGSTAAADARFAGGRITDGGARVEVGRDLSTARAPNGDDDDELRPQHPCRLPRGIARLRLVLRLHPRFRVRVS